MMPFFLILMLAAYIGGNAYIFTRAPPPHRIPRRPRETLVLRGRWLMGKGLSDYKRP